GVIPKARTGRKETLQACEAARPRPLSGARTSLYWLSSPSIAEGWPSGLRRTLGKRVYGKPYRGFESHSLRQIPLGPTRTRDLSDVEEDGHGKAQQTGGHGGGSALEQTRRRRNSWCRRFEAPDR